MLLRLEPQVHLSKFPPIRHTTFAFGGQFPGFGAACSRTSFSSLGSKKTETAVKEMRRPPDRRQETECAQRNALLDSSVHNGGPMMGFRISGLPADQFADLFTLSDQELVARGAVRRIAAERTPGYPCRVSLTDSRPGDELLL